MIINANAHNPVGMHMELLWNDNYNTLTEQKINLNLTTCSFVCVLFKVSSANSLICANLTPIDFVGNVTAESIYYENKYTYTRKYSIERDGITFHKCEWHNTSTGESASNSSYLLPFRIYTLR